MTYAVIIGVASGVISGMGIGGGTILIPALALFLGTDQHIAQGVNLLYFIPTAAIALIVHFKNKAINLKAAIPIMLFGIAGAAGGSILAGVVDAPLLRKLFGGFLFAMGLYEFFKKDKSEKKQNRHLDKS